MEHKERQEKHDFERFTIHATVLPTVHTDTQTHTHTDTHTHAHTHTRTHHTHKHTHTHTCVHATPVALLTVRPTAIMLQPGTALPGTLTEGDNL